ncbi:MAG TPA: hypothetical protein PLL73_00255 [Syntrophorhabdaceae bacterium]|nr:hypothetical protein [Syntrophorhabdaceae bacterium]
MLAVACCLPVFVCPYAIEKVISGIKARVDIGKSITLFVLLLDMLMPSFSIASHFLLVSKGRNVIVHAE